ncbi:hypothetical protein ACMFMG_012175 [Clarireedia jacksonii]
MRANSMSVQVVRYMRRSILNLALSPVPVLSLVLTLFLELLNVIAKRVAVILGPVGTIAIVLLEVVTNLVRDSPVLIHRFVGVLASVCIVAASICGSGREEECDICKLHDDVVDRVGVLLVLKK